jgi:hypothetical protein
LQVQVSGLIADSRCRTRQMMEEVKVEGPKDEG